MKKPSHKNPITDKYKWGFRNANYSITLIYTSAIKPNQHQHGKGIDVERKYKITNHQAMKIITPRPKEVLRLQNRTKTSIESPAVQKTAFINIKVKFECALRSQLIIYNNTILTKKKKKRWSPRQELDHNTHSKYLSTINDALLSPEFWILISH